VGVQIPLRAAFYKGGSMSVEMIGALVVVGLIGAFFYLRSRKD
tara:strand:- start:7 stop:135 length:129 start_codon:yes stop_codon:yes gene_type:complete